MLETVWRLRDEDKQIGYARENRNIVRWCRAQASSSHSWQGVVDDRNNEAGVSTTAPGRSAAHDVDDQVLSSFTGVSRCEQQKGQVFCPMTIRLCLSLMKPSYIVVYVLYFETLSTLRSIRNEFVIFFQTLFIYKYEYLYIN